MIPAELGSLSAAERQVWDAFPYGRKVTLPEGAPRAVRATVIRSLLLGAQPEEPGHQAALLLHGAEVTGVLDLRHAEVESAIDFVGCTFDTVPMLSFARLRGVSFEGSTLPGLDAFAATVQGTLSFVKSTLTGAIVIYGVQVSGDLDLDWAHLSADGRPEELFGDRVAALFGEAIQVSRHLYLRGTTATGDLELAGLRVGGRLTLLPERVDGTIDLSHAQVQVLRDDPDGPPAPVRLDGARYTALEPAGTPGRRLRWLEEDPAGYRPQPYEQLATFYRQAGHEADARTVLLAKQRRRRGQLPPAGAAWSLLQDALVGYGYRPGRAALWLLALTALGTTVFSVYPPRGGAGGPAFHPLVYTLDLLIPIVTFGQERTFGFTGGAQWLAYVLTALGWVLFTAVAAALTRTFSRP